MGEWEGGRVVMEGRVFVDVSDLIPHLVLLSHRYFRSATIPSLYRCPESLPQGLEISSERCGVEWLL